MNNRFLSHFMHYLLLSFLIGLGVFGIYFFSGNPQRQFQIAIVTSLAYFFWGISHHFLEGDLHLKIVVEYLLIVLLSILLLRGAIFK